MPNRHDDWPRLAFRQPAVGRQSVTDSHRQQLDQPRQQPRSHDGMCFLFLKVKILQAMAALRCWTEAPPANGHRLILVVPASYYGQYGQYGRRRAGVVVHRVHPYCPSFCRSQAAGYGHAARRNIVITSDRLRLRRWRSPIDIHGPSQADFSRRARTIDGAPRVGTDLRTARNIAENRHFHAKSPVTAFCALP